MILDATKVDFPKLASQIAEDYFTDGTSLTEGVVKVAKQYSFNPEEIKRLSEKTNTHAVVRMLKTAEDKKGTIPVVDYKAVLTQTHPTETPYEVVKLASTNFEIPYTRKNTKLEKVAFQKLASPEPKQERILPEIFKKEKEIQDLNQEKIAAEISTQDNIDFIISEFYKYNAPNFSKFAAEAYAMVGKKSKLLLNKMAEYLKVKEKDTNFEKQARDLTYVDDSDPLLKRFETVITNLTKIAHLETKKKDLQGELELLWAKAKENGR